MHVRQSSGHIEGKNVAKGAHLKANAALGEGSGGVSAGGHGSSGTYKADFPLVASIKRKKGSTFSSIPLPSNFKSMPVTEFCEQAMALLAKEEEVPESWNLLYVEARKDANTEMAERHQKRVQEEHFAAQRSLMEILKKNPQEAKKMKRLEDMLHPCNEDAKKMLHDKEICMTEAELFKL